MSGINEANFVDFSDGYGAGSLNDVSELNKALEAGTAYLQTPQSRTGSPAMQVESLDGSLKSVTFEMKHLKMWPTMAKDRAYNTIEEYNRQDRYGDQGLGWIAEGALPRSQDANYTRQAQRIRFIGVTRELTHVYTLVRNAGGDAIAREIKNGTMTILEIVERGLHDGRGHYSNAGKFDGAAAILDADLAWEGLDIQIRAGENDSSAQAQAFTGYGLSERTVRDQEGETLDEDALEEGARVVSENFGLPNLCEMETKAMSDLAKTFYPKERINTMGVQQGRAGFVLTEFVSSAGAFALTSNVFIRPKRRPTDAVSATAPAQPTGSAAPAAQSRFTASWADDHVYYATAITKDGESAASPESAAIAVAAGDAVSLTVPGVAGAHAYAVYRRRNSSLAGSGEFIGYVAPTIVGGSASFTDLNHKLPGLSQAYLMTMDTENVRFKQLAPLMKFDLATVQTSYRWAQLLYGTPIVYTPRKQFLYENIGRSAA